MISGELSKAGYRGQFLSGAIRLEPRERVVRIDRFQVTAMQVGHRVVATSAWEVGSDRGSLYSGVSVASWEGAVPMAFEVWLGRDGVVEIGAG